MKSLRRILVPTDLSASSLEALRFAYEIADPAVTEVVLLHALGERTGQRLQRFRNDEAEMNARKKLIHLLTQQRLIRGDLRIFLASQRPVASIIEAVSRLNADFIVMATHGRTGLNHALVGSVAEEVVRLSTVPVLVVKMPGEEPARLCETEIQTHLHLN